MKYIVLLKFIIVFIFPSSVYCEEKQVTLYCTYEITYDGNKPELTIGNDIFTVYYLDNNKIRIKRISESVRLGGTEYLGEQTDAYLFGYTQYNISKNNEFETKESLMINRYNGEFEFIIDAKSTLIHHGTCDKNKEKLF